MDLAHQLLESHDPWESNEETNLNSPWGIPLAKGIKATDLSLLAEPKTYTTSTDKPRRAVAIVSSPNMETGEMEYATFQLQMSKRCNSGDAKTYEEQKPYNVLVKPSVHGTLKNGARSIGPISSSFVAGASFRFDLEKFGKNGHKLNFHSFKGTSMLIFTFFCFGI